MSDIVIDKAIPKDIRRLLKYLNDSNIMALMSGEGSTQYTYFLNPLTGLKVRIGNREDTFVIDKELTVDGFNQDLGSGEGIDVGWEYIGGAI